MLAKSVPGKGGFTKHIVGNKVRYQLKATPTMPKKVEATKQKATNEKIAKDASTNGTIVDTSNQFAALDMEDIDVNAIPCTTPIVEKIEKIEKLIIDGKATLVDDNGNPLKRVDEFRTIGMESQDQIVSELKEMEQSADSKPSSSSFTYTSSTKVGNPFLKVEEVVVSDIDDEEVFEPDNPMAKFLASTGGGHELEDYYDDYADQLYDLPGQLFAFCDLCDIKLQDRNFAFLVGHKIDMSFLCSVLIVAQQVLFMPM